jgi:hypothetical protein
LPGSERKGLGVERSRGQQAQGRNRIAESVPSRSCHTTCTIASADGPWRTIRVIWPEC